VIAILLTTLGYNYVSNLARSTSALEVVWSSLTRLQNKDSVQAFGILALVVTTWLASALVFSAENNQAKTPQIWLRMFGVTILISGAIGGLYWLIQAGNLAAIARITPRNQEDVLTQIAGFGNLLSAFYLFLGMLLALLALALRDVSPSRLFHNSGITPLLAPVIALAVLGIAYTTNLRVVQADITFKMADPFARETQWPVSILVYQRAIQQAPMEDYYYLFLSRAYLEYAKTLQAPEERNTLMTQAEKDLLKAQQLNPLNTDHTANLARLSSWWSSTTSDQARRKALAKQSDDYYAKALTLSPNNAVLYAERAVVQLNFLDEDQAALETLRTALQVDPLYDRTHAILGDYSVQQARALPEGAEQISLLEEAARQYQEALANLPNSSDARPARYTYSLALASVYLDLEQIPQAIDTYQQSIASASGQDVWRVEQTIAQLYLQIQDKPNALVHAQRALDLAPESEKARLETLIKQIQAATP
jgi:tetratricopeptide (TPR) repeat protein